LNKARRAKVVDMDSVRDDGFKNEIPNFFGSADHFLDAVRVSARLLRLDRQAGQARRLALRRDLASRFSVTLITLLRDAHPGAID